MALAWAVFVVTGHLRVRAALGASGPRTLTPAIVLPAAAGLVALGVCGWLATAC